MEYFSSCRQRGRAEQFRQWTADAGQFQREQREKTRQRQQMKAAKHLAEMEAIEREKEMDKLLNCPLCDVVRAEAYGLGHAGWRGRKCSNCFRATSERLAKERHSSPSADAALTSLILGMTVQARLDKMESEVYYDQSMASSSYFREAFLPHRSRRLSSSPVPSHPPYHPDGSAIYHEAAPPHDPQVEDLVEEDAEGVDLVLSALKNGDMKEVMRIVVARPHLEQVLDKALPPPQSQDQGRKDPASTATASIPLSSYQPANPSFPAIENIRAELKQAEQDLVFAPTQRERSAALNLAFKLRKELAMLADLDRREKRAKEIGKYKMRGPSGPEARQSKKDGSHFDPSEGIKFVIRDQDVGKGAPVKGCPGLAIAAESKARRTERALKERKQLDSKGSLPGFGIVATPTAAARAREESNQFKRPGSSQSHTKHAAAQRMDQRSHLTHPDKPDPSRMTDAVTWRPVSSRLPSYHPPGYGQAGDYDGIDPMAELAKLRSMKVDDYKSLMRKEREWKRAVAEVALELETQLQMEPS